MNDCRHPECNDGASETYRDRFGNELEVCGQHYFEAVWPTPAVSRVTTRTDADSPGGMLGWLRE